MDPLSIALLLFAGVTGGIISALAGGASIITFPMMASAVLGGFTGARIAQWVPNEAARWIVVMIGALLTVAFAWRYWF